MRRKPPAILDADETDYMPPEVWVPVQTLADGATEAVVELRETKDGRVALVAFSTPERLLEGCGPDQPCAKVEAAELDRLQWVVGFECILLDVALPDPAESGADLPLLSPDPTLGSGLLYVPSRSHRMGSDWAQLKLFETETGEAALLAYSSKQQFYACCGTRQPWVAIHAEAIEDVCYQVRADIVIMDHPMRGVRSRR